jgi:hypothetical protein
MTLFVVSLLLVLQPPQNVEQPVKAPDPKQAIRKILGEASELYKKHIREVKAAKSSAEATDRIQIAQEAFREWCLTLEDVPMEMMCRVKDIVKSDEAEIYYAVLRPPKELEQFATINKTPTSAMPTYKMTLTDEQYSKLKVNSSVIVTGKINPSYKFVVVSQYVNSRYEYITVPYPHQEYFGGSDTPVLFTCRFGGVVFSGSESLQDSTSLKGENFVTFMVDDAKLQLPNEKRAGDK